MPPGAAATAVPASLVEARGLTRIYEVGGQTVTSLVDVDLSIGDGEYVAIMGPSGSGKSTMLNILGCLDRPTRGTYRVGGEDTASLDSDALASLRNRRIGFCFQSFNLLPRSTALENVILPLVYAGVPRREREARAREVLGEVGLGERTHHRPSQLSGGQQQRVAIARAMVTNPDILLCDEPTGALDTSTGLEIMALLARLNAAGRTVIVVTHDPAVAAHAHRVVRLRDGRIESDEATGDAPAAPAPHHYGEAVPA